MDKYKYKTKDTLVNEEMPHEENCICLLVDGFLFHLYMYWNVVFTHAPYKPSQQIKPYLELVFFWPTTFLKI